MSSQHHSVVTHPALKSLASRAPELVTLVLVVAIFVGFLDRQQERLDRQSDRIAQERIAVIRALEHCAQQSRRMSDSVLKFDEPNG